MAELRLRPAIIPTRILLMIIHLLLTIIAFADRQENMSQCLPYTAQLSDYASSGQWTGVTVAIIIAWVCFLYEFLSSLSGILMYNHYNNAWSVCLHALCILLLLWYLSAYWPCTAIWPITVFGSLVPAISDLLTILFTRLILRAAYLPPRI